MGLGAWYGTWLLMTGPDSATVPLGAPEWLPGGWFSGGIALALIVAVPMTAAWGLLLTATGPVAPQRCWQGCC